MYIQRRLVCVYRQRGAGWPARVSWKNKSDVTSDGQEFAELSYLLILLEATVLCKSTVLTVTSLSSVLESALRVHFNTWTL